MPLSKQSLYCLFHRLGLILVVATAGFSFSGCCAGLSRHQPIACYECARTSHDCHCQQGQAPAPVAATGARVQPADPAALFVPPPTTPAPKLQIRPALIKTKPKTAKAPQTIARSSPDVASDAVANELPAIDHAAASPRASSSRVIPFSRNAAATQNHVVEDFLPAATDETTPSSPIENAPKPPSSNDNDSPTVKPSNTLIMEIDAVDPPIPESSDQSQGRPAQAIPKLKAIVDSDFSTALQMSGRDDPQATVANSQRIMFAVPQLRPSNIPPIVRFVRIEDSWTAKNQRPPYSLTTGPVQPGTDVRPIEPVLEGLRIGRPITPATPVETIQR